MTKLHIYQEDLCAILNNKKKLTIKEGYKVIEICDDGDDGFIVSIDIDYEQDVVKQAVKNVAEIQDRVKRATKAFSDIIRGEDKKK